MKIGPNRLYAYNQRIWNQGKSIYKKEDEEVEKQKEDYMYVFEEKM